MLAMPGLRAFSLARKRGAEGVSCDASGVFVGGVPLLQPPGAGNPSWSARQLVELNKELTVRYRLPIDIGSKAGALALIATAFNRGDVAMAAIAAVQMQFSDPPSLAKRSEDRDDIARRAQELACSGLLKFWDPALHPRAGVPPNPGWFGPVAQGSETATVEPVVMRWPPWQKPEILEGGGGGGVPRGQLEFPSIRWPWSRGPSPEASRGTPNPPGPVEAAPSSAVETQPPLPFSEGLPPQLAPYTGGKTFGIFQPQSGSSVVLQSGRVGPAAAMPPESTGFDAYTKTHVEGQAAALMRQEGYTEGTLILSNPDICVRCMSLLPRMLPPGSTLHVILPDNTVNDFQGAFP